MKVHLVGLIILGVSLHPVAMTTPVTVQSCAGCNGSGASSDSDTWGGASCPDGNVTITVNAKDGKCMPLATYPPGSPECIAAPCKVTITRGWSHLPANTAMEWCYSDGTSTTCVTNPPPSTGSSGSGSNTRTAWMNCSGAPYTFYNTHPCGLSATAFASCSPCDGVAQ